MLKTKLIISGLCLSLGLGAAAFRGRTPHLEQLQALSGVSADPNRARAELLSLARKNLALHLKSRYRFVLQDHQVQLVELPQRALSIGRPMLVFFSAQRPEAPHEGRDLYMLQVNLGENAIPISFTPPRNLTENPNSQDDLFAVSTRGARILYGQLTKDGACRAVTQLSWDPRDLSRDDDTGLISQLKLAHHYDIGTAPKWLTLRFKTPLPQCQAHFSSDQGAFVVLSGDFEAFKLDLATEQVTPSGQGVEVVKAPAPRPQLLEGLQDLLSDYGLINLEERLSLTAAHATFVNALERNLYEIFVDQSDPKQHQPIGQLSSMTDGRRPFWYPAKIDVRGGVKGEGVWRPVKLGDERAALALQTFIRLDEEHPYRSVQLFAFDMRRLGLHFVGGADPSEQLLEGVGSGKVPQHHQAQLVAAFNGGPTMSPQQGVVQEGHTLIPPSLGLSSVALDARGRALFGRLDHEPLPSQWSSLRQSFAPLIDQRVIQKTPPPQSPLGRLDHLKIARSAMGVTNSGTLIYAWSEAATVEHMATALKRVGVVFALSLKSDTAQTGLAFYPNGSASDASSSTLNKRSPQPRAGHKKMELSPQAWLKGSDRDFFYLVRAQSLPDALRGRQSAWGPHEGVWEPIAHQDVDPLIATSYLSAQRAGGEVQLTRVDGDRIQLNFALSSTRLGGDRERPLPTSPTARLPLGLIGPQMGLKSLGKLLQAPVEGAMTWASDAQGRSLFGRWGEGALTDQSELNDLIQGVTLIHEGQRVTNLNDAPHASLALGVALNGDLIFALSERGELNALARALELAGAVNALLLTGQGTADVGQLQAFYEHQGRTYYTLPPQRALKPALLGEERSALLGLSDALIMTPRAAAHRARFVYSFKELTQAPNLLK